MSSPSAEFEPIKEMPERLVGHLGWVATAAVVAAWDYYAPETMSNAFKRGREHPVARFAVVGAWAVTTAHLMDWLPDNIDPFDNLGRILGKQKQ